MQPSPNFDCKVLVVDDCPDIAALVLAYSEKLPIQEVVAETASAGIKRLRKTSFDLVLMDFNLPDMNGAAAVGKIRRWERQWRAPRLPVFALTDLHDFRLGELMMGAGCTGLVGKPLFRDQFVALASRHRRQA